MGMAVEVKGLLSRDILAEKWEQMLVAVMRVVPGLSEKAEKPVEVDKQVETVEPTYDESLRLEIELHNQEREQLRVEMEQFKIRERALDDERERQKKTVSGVVNNWSWVLEKRGLKEELPLVWNLTDRVMQPVNPEQEFFLPGYDGYVGLGRIRDEGRSGIQANIYHHEKFGMQLSLSIVIGDSPNGGVTSFFVGWNARNGEEKDLTRINFAGGERIDWDKLLERTQKTTTKLIGLTAAHD